MERAKNLFRKCRDERRELEILTEKQEQLRTSLYPQAVRIKEISVQESGADDQMSSRLAAVVDMDKEIDGLRFNILIRQLQAYQIISRIKEPKHRQVLELYYLMDKKGGGFYTWEDVAEIMHYSEIWVKRLHGYALLDADKVYTQIYGQM